MGDFAASRIGVEEEFHLVDLQTRRTSPAVDAMLAQLDGGSFAPELQRSLVEANTLPCETLDELGAELRRLRHRLNEVADPLGLGVVASGTVPLVELPGHDISGGARYERMQREYQVLVREQHICGAQVHVDVPDRDVAVGVVHHVAVHLPTFLALSASSPYWRGLDTGYASYRCMIWQRWPTAGPPGPMRTAADYDAMVADLVASGTISDPGMVYFDIRPAVHLPTVELRICDACPAVDDVVLIAGLFRALVQRARRWVEEGKAFPTTRHELLRAATWRAARSGLEGDLVDLVNPSGPTLVPPSLLVERLVNDLRPELEAFGDWEQVLELSLRAVETGSAAARQRRVSGRRGELTDVVDGLLAQTRGESPHVRPPATVPTAPALLESYHGTGYDEAVSANGRVLPHYGWMFRTLDRLGARGMAAAMSGLRTEQRARGVTFRVADDEPDRLFPLDVVPRIITAQDWATLTPGLIQRVRALEAFLHDAYGAQQAVRDGVLPAAVVSGSPGRSRFGGLCSQHTVRTAVSGIDLVRDSADGWLVLEDNLRVPSGIGYAMTSRRLFAFAVLERDGGKVVLGRDRLGIKPVYLATSPGRLRFASTLPALLAAGEVDTDIDRIALHHYLSFHSVVPSPRTVLAGVQKLPPATVRTVHPDGRTEDRTYWHPPFTRARPEVDDWPAAVLESLRVAVERRMVADVPVGVLLSGGIDSSLVVALLAESGQHGLRTFSVGFEAAGGESGDEFGYSDLVAKHFDTDHQKIMVSSDRLLPAVDAAIAAMSEPMVSHDCVAFYLLSQEVSRSVTVVQSGQGADEVFAGYDWYPPLAGVPRELAPAAYAKVFVDRPHAELADLVEPEWLADSDHSQAFVDAHFGAPGAESALDAALRLDTSVMLVDDPVKRVDNMTMAWGLEARVPFLDHELVELAGACPPELKLAHGGKGVLKQASRGVVPDAIIDRPKGYFPVPAIRHLSGSFLDRVRDAVTDPVAKDRGLFRPDWLQRMLADPNTERTTLGSNALWQVALLEMWLQEKGI